MIYLFGRANRLLDQQTKSQINGLVFLKAFQQHQQQQTPAPQP